MPPSATMPTKRIRSGTGCGSAQPHRTSDSNLRWPKWPSEPYRQGQQSVPYRTGLVSSPEATAPGPSDLDLGEQLQGEACWELDKGELYWDGSASTLAMEGCCRAAWAVVQYQAGAEAPFRVVRGAVPSCYPQTAQAAETVALWASTSLQPRSQAAPGTGGEGHGGLDNGAAAAAAAASSDEEHQEPITGRKGHVENPARPSGGRTGPPSGATTGPPAPQKNAS